MIFMETIENIPPKGIEEQTMEKQTFILYVESANQVDILTDEEAGQLLKALFRYVSDGEMLVTENRTLAIVFSAIKTRIDRDSAKYAEICVKRKKAAEKKWAISKCIQKHPLASNTMQMDANGGDSDYYNDNVNDNEIENDVLNENYNSDTQEAFPHSDIEIRKEHFYHSLMPFVGQYGDDMIADFFDYWSEPNRSNTKMRFELEKTWDVSRRLRRWAAQDNNYQQFKTHGDTDRYHQKPTPEENRRTASAEIEREIAASIEAARKAGH